MKNSNESMRQSDYMDILKNCLTYSSENSYIGYDKHDGMSNIISRKIPIDNKWINLFLQESIKRAPVNIRPYLLVEQRPSPVGFALFTLANWNMYHLASRDKYFQNAEFLINQVVEFGSETETGFALYHNHEFQTLDQKKPRKVPMIVETTRGIKALLSMTEVDGNYGDIAHTVHEFVQKRLDPSHDDDRLRIKYTPVSNPDHYTINANAVAGAMYADLFAHKPKLEYKEYSKSLLQYVASCQEPEGGWMYNDPPSTSHLSMDNYHNGYIIESFQRYREVFDSNAFNDVFSNAISFYRDQLFGPNGAPHWDENSKYPRDICGAAQGIITFSKIGDLKQAKTILDWTIDNLYAGDGRFYYQQRKYYTKRFTLMRWCQAWMAYALSEYLLQAESG